MSKVGFIGLGIMGRPMASHLLDAGHELTTVKRGKPLATELADKGMQELHSPRAVAEQAEVIITMVPDTSDVEAVLFGAEGVIEGLKPGTLVIDMSSIAPLGTQGFTKRIVEAGGEYVDAPVFGGESGAINAALTIMVGATVEGFTRASPILEVMGKTITHIGGHGAGQTCKVANQIVVALTIEAVAEGLLFASRAGADVAKVRESLLGGLAQSKILDVHGERMIKRTFDPGFKIKLHPEGPQPGAGGCAQPRTGAAWHRQRPAAVPGLCGAWWRGVGSCRHLAGT